jgi:uncharacterized protein
MENPADASHGNVEPDDDATEVWRSLHPRMVLRWRLDLLGTGLTAAVLLGATELTARSADLLGAVPPGLIPGMVAGITAVVTAIWPPLAYRRWSYRLGAEALEIRRGVVVQRQSSVPYRRVQQVDLSRGPIDRLLGLTTADLTTAAATTDGSVPGLAPSDAEHFRRRVLERAGRDDAV